MCTSEARVLKTPATALSDDKVHYRRTALSRSLGCDVRNGCGSRHFRVGDVPVTGILACATVTRVLNFYYADL